MIKPATGLINSSADEFKMRFGVKSIVKQRAASTCAAFANVAAMSKPSSLEDAVARTKQNLVSFRVIYAGVTLVLLVGNAAAHPIRMLLFLGMIASWFAYAASDPLAPTTIGSKTIEPGLKCAGVISINFMGLFFGGVLHSLLWVGSIGLAASVAHASCREAWELPPPIEEEFGAEV